MICNYTHYDYNDGYILNILFMHFSYLLNSSLILKRVPLYSDLQTTPFCRHILCCYELKYWFFCCNGDRISIQIRIDSATDAQQQTSHLDINCSR